MNFDVLSHNTTVIILAGFFAVVLIPAVMNRDQFGKEVSKSIATIISMILGLTIALAQNRYTEQLKLHNEISGTLYSLMSESEREINDFHNRIHSWDYKKFNLEQIDNDIQEFPPHTLISLEHLVKSSDFANFEKDKYMLSEIYSFYYEINRNAYSATHSLTQRERVQSYFNYENNVSYALVTSCCEGRYIGRVLNEHEKRVIIGECYNELYIKNLVYPLVVVERLKTRIFSEK